MVYFDNSLDHSQHSLITVDEKEEPIRQPACPCLRFSLEANTVFIIPNRDEFTPEEKEAAAAAKLQAAATVPKAAPKKTEASNKFALLMDDSDSD